MRTKLFIAAISMTLLLGSCNTDDPIYETDHPEQGKIILTTDWTNRTSGVDIPLSYTVRVGDYLTTISGETNTIDNLFVPATYRMCIYNPADHLTVSGTTATADYAAGTAGWFFSCAMDAIIEKDREHVFTAVMRQQVRELTLVIEPMGETAARIERITASLSGVAGTLDIDNETHGTASNIALNFTKITSGEDAGKWSATVRLLGVTGNEQILSGTIAFASGAPNDMTLESDLTAALENFNADKKTPLTLGGELVDTPSGVGFGTTINAWQEQSIINGEAEY